MTSNKLELIYLKGTKNKEKTFLQFKDVKKATLKKFEDEFSSFPLMSDEVKEYRKNVVRDICRHFGKKDITFLTDGDEDSNHWPLFMSFIITPRILDELPVEWFSKEFGFCQFCKHFKGHKKGHHKLFHATGNKDKKVISVYGKCKSGRSYIGGKWEKHNNSVVAYYRCRTWVPTALIQQVLELRLQRLLEKMNYPIPEYKKDLTDVNASEYFSY